MKAMAYKPESKFYRDLAPKNLRAAHLGRPHRLMPDGIAQEARLDSQQSPWL